MTAPALMIIEGFKPLNWIGSQFLLLIEPITVYIFNFRQIQIIRRALQKREAMEQLARRIEEADAKYGPKKRSAKKRSSDEQET